MDLMRRHPVAGSVTLCVALGATLITVAFAMPLRDNVDHAAGHLALAVPVLLLLGWGLLWWPPAGPVLSARLARGILLAGLAIAGLGLVIEAVGAFGYGTDQVSSANDLTVFHAIGVELWPVGFVAVMAGAITSTGVGLAGRRGAEDSRIVAWSVAVAVVAMVGFVAGGFIFGY